MSNYKFNYLITKKSREVFLKQKGFVIWITGLSGAGKSTLASVLEKKIFALEKLTYVLDGDNVRSSLNNDLGFSNSDRFENIRRVAEVSKILLDLGVIVIVAVISPEKIQRDFAKKTISKNKFIEVYLDTSIKLCQKRDPKKLYEKAKNGTISDMTGISNLYETPAFPSIAIKGTLKTENQVQLIFNYLIKNKFIT